MSASQKRIRGFAGECHALTCGCDVFIERDDGLRCEGFDDEHEIRRLDMVATRRQVALLVDG